MSVRSTLSILKRDGKFIILNKMRKKNKAESNNRINEIVFFPQVPHYPYVIWKILKTLGIKVKAYNPWDKSSIIIYYEDDTFSSFDVKKYINSSIKGNHSYIILNEGCVDISKKRVGEVFLKTFNYNLDVDPTKYKGSVVKKSDLNAAHDGVVIHCPINDDEVESGFVYSRLINNGVKPGFIEDLRVPIFIDEIPFVYKKHRKITDRFSNTNDIVYMVETKDVLTPEEVGNIISFTKEIGLDIGEIDVLRDVDTQQIFIIDVNKTPAGPPNHLPKSLYYKALFKLSQAFEISLQKVLK